MRKAMAGFVPALAVLSVLATGPVTAHAHDASPPLVTMQPPGDAAAPGTGFEGRMLYNDNEIPGVRVYAYLSYGDLLARKTFAVSEPSAEDGTYNLDLPPATYFLVARKTTAAAGDGLLQIGDFFCYQGSNPITVVKGSYTHVGFMLTKKEKEVIYEDGSDPLSGSIRGVVRYRGEPLEGATVFLFLDSEQNFRGMVYASSPPVGTSGTFRLNTLPESNYFVIVRKRSGKGPAAGPIGDGDYFGYFIENPVAVKVGKTAVIEVDLLSKMGQIVKKGTAFRDTGTQIRGRITDKEGKPAKGVYTFAYREKVMAHKRPEFISRLVDENGNYVLNLSEGGTYYIGARSSYGEGPGMNEWYGRYDVTADHSVKLEAGQKLEGVDIQVELILP